MACRVRAALAADREAALPSPHDTRITARVTAINIRRIFSIASHHRDRRGQLAIRLSVDTSAGKYISIRYGAPGHIGQTSTCPPL
ncbi:hypothetical protein GCM10027259_07790 [Micromonospora palomenae]